MRSILNAYAEGYNLYLSQHRDRAPEWAFEINGADVLAHCRALIILDFATDHQYLRIPSDEAVKGSNMLILGNPRTRSKHGILLANPHLGWDSAYDSTKCT